MSAPVAEFRRPPPARLAPPSDFTVGLDLGQAQDPSALAVVERRRVRDEAKPWTEEYYHTFHLRHLERLSLGMLYPQQVAHVRRLLDTAPLCGGARLVLDRTGVGRPVADLFVAAGLRPRPIAVTIVAGDVETRDGADWRVGKLRLVSRLQALLHAGELKVAAALPLADVLVQELSDFQVKYSDTGHASFGARSGRHDDLVLALAIAVWHSSRQQASGASVVELPW